MPQNIEPSSNEGATSSSASYRSGRQRHASILDQAILGLKKRTYKKEKEKPKKARRIEFSKPVIDSFDVDSKGVYSRDWKNDAEIPLPSCFIRPCHQAGRLLRDLLNIPAFYRWVRCEFLYNAVDRGFYLHNPFVDSLARLGLSHITKLTRPEWSLVREAIGRPRLFSKAFIEEEKIRLNRYRVNSRRITLGFEPILTAFDGDFDYTIFDIIPIGTPVSFTPPGYRWLTTGYVEAYDPITSTYSIRSDKNFELAGNLTNLFSVIDYLVFPHHSLPKKVNGIIRAHPSLIHQYLSHRNNLVRNSFLGLSSDANNSHLVSTNSSEEKNKTVEKTETSRPKRTAALKSRHIYGDCDEEGYGSSAIRGNMSNYVTDAYSQSHTGYLNDGNAYVVISPHDPWVLEEFTMKLSFHNRKMLMPTSTSGISIVSSTSKKNLSNKFDETISHHNKSSMDLERIPIQKFGENLIVTVPNQDSPSKTSQSSNIGLVSNVGVELSESSQSVIRDAVHLNAFGRESRMASVDSSSDIKVEITSSIDVDESDVSKSQPPAPTISLPFVEKVHSGKIFKVSHGNSDPFISVGCPLAVKVDQDAVLLLNTHQVPKDEGGLSTVLKDQLKDSQTLTTQTVRSDMKYHNPSRNSGSEWMVGAPKRMRDFTEICKVVMQKATVATALKPWIDSCDSSKGLSPLFSPLNFKLSSPDSHAVDDSGPDATDIHVRRAIIKSKSVLGKALTNLRTEWLNQTTESTNSDVSATFRRARAKLQVVDSVTIEPTYSSTALNERRGQLLEHNNGSVLSSPGSTLGDSASDVFDNSSLPTGKPPKRKRTDSVDIVEYTTNALALLYRLQGRSVGAVHGGLSLIDATPAGPLTLESSLKYSAFSADINSNGESSVSPELRRAAGSVFSSTDVSNNSSLSNFISPIHESNKDLYDKLKEHLDGLI